MSIIACDMYYEDVDTPNVLLGGGFCSTPSSVERHLDEIIGPFDPTGYTLLDFDMGEEIPLKNYKDYTWYRAKFNGKDTILAAWER